MNYRIPCEIIRDLMPMYADGLTSETTAKSGSIWRNAAPAGKCMSG